MRLALGLPWDSPFAWRRSMLSIINVCCAFRRPGWELQCVMGRGVMPARRHIDCLEQALAWDADLFCFLGADQVYAPDLLERLVARWEAVHGQGIIGAMVPMRGFVDWQPGMRPFQPLAWRSPYLGQDGDGKPTLIERTDGDFVRANILGTGVLLFHMDLVRHLRRPWLYERVDPETMHRVADQDSHFVARLQYETGTPLYVDTTILVTHLHDLAIDDSFQTRFADWANPATPDIDRSIVKFAAELPQPSMPQPLQEISYAHERRALPDNDYEERHESASSISGRRGRGSEESDDGRYPHA